MEITDKRIEELRERFFGECTELKPSCYVTPGVPTPSIMKRVNMAPHDLFEWFKSALRELTEQQELGGTVPDLSGLDKKNMDEFLMEFIQMTAKNVLSVFVALGLKSHIETTVVNDYDNSSFDLIFRKTPEPGEQTHYREVKCSERLPTKEGIYFVEDENGARFTDRFIQGDWYSYPIHKLQYWLEKVESKKPNELIKSLGDPVEDNAYEIKAIKGEWWITHKHVGSGEPLEQWLAAPNL